jgi:hypothetical protein
MFTFIDIYSFIPVNRARCTGLLVAHSAAKTGLCTCIVSNDVYNLF